MSSNRSVVRDGIRELIRDMNPSESVVNDFHMNDSIQRNMHLIAGRCAMPRESITSVTLVNGTFEYTVSSTTAKSVSLVLLNSTGRELDFVPWEQFNAYYKQDSAQPRGTGAPREYTLREDTSSVLRLRFGPTPNAADSAKVHLSILPAVLATDATSIPFANDLVRALELMCAAEIVGAMDEERRKKLGLSGSAPQVWNTAAGRVIHDYNIRMGDLGARQNRIMRGNRRGHAFWGAW